MKSTSRSASPPVQPGAARRRLLQAISALPMRNRLLAAGAAALPVPGLAATPACGGDSRGTPRQTEGPYFTRNSPQRQSLLEDGIGGIMLVLSGAVRATDCRLLPGALLDFWQADAEGVYDNRGFRLRGHQFTGADGRYRLETVVPGLYPGRTRHIHVKVQAPDGPVLTTQLYFPGEPGNRSDRLFSPILVVSVDSATGAAAGSTRQPAADPFGGSSGSIRASFDFVLPAG